MKPESKKSSKLHNKKRKSVLVVERKKKNKQLKLGNSSTSSSANVISSKPIRQNSRTNVNQIPKQSNQFIKNNVKDNVFGKHKKPDVWFDDVAPALIASSMQDEAATTKSLVKTSSFTGPTRRIAIDCEFVGVGFEGKDNALARVSIVNQFGHILLDAYVRPNERVVDYRTQYSGIRPNDLKLSNGARSFHDVHKEVAKLCKGRILVGHSLGNDLKVLMLSHPRRDIRDTSRYKPFRSLFSGRTPSLRALTQQVLGVTVQEGEHDSVEDARAAMRLYTSVKRVWESSKKNRLANTTALKNQLMQKSGKPSSPTINPVLDIKSEYESGLNPLSNKTSISSSKPLQNKFKQKPKSKSWDYGRDRKCSKNRARFIEKRRKRKTNYTSAALG